MVYICGTNNIFPKKFNSTLISTDVSSSLKYYKGDSFQFSCCHYFFFFFFHFVESELLNLFLGVTGPIAHAIQPFLNFNSLVKPRPFDYWVSCCVTKHYHCSSQLSSFEVILRALIVVNRCYVVCDGKKQNKKSKLSTVLNHFVD